MNRSKSLLVRFLVAVGLVAAGCSGGQVCRDLAIEAGTALECEVQGFEKRPYLVDLPEVFNTATRTGVVLALHGGGGKAAGMHEFMCPDGDEESPGCMRTMAGERGLVVVYPNGTSSRFARGVRTWNGGGGIDDWQCVSGRACESGVDDMAYFDALLDDLASWMTVDENRVFATGISNGAAIAHRLACERADRIAAIVAVGGGNQLAVAQGCLPSRPVPVMQIHGTEDPCWPFEGGVAAVCVQKDEKVKVSVPVSIDTWASTNGCTKVRTQDWPDDTDDGLTTTRETHSGCDEGAEVILMKIEGGGHTWPDGQPYLPRVVGPVTHDFGNEVILDFFEAHPKP